MVFCSLKKELFDEGGGWTYVPECNNLTGNDIFDDRAVYKWRHDRGGGGFWSAWLLTIKDA